MADRLIAAGWQVLARQVRVGRGEIDLLARDPGPPGALVVVEVRCRRDGAFGLPEETVDARKRARLHAAGWRLVEAGLLPDGRRLPRLPLRFDLVAVDMPRPPGRTVIRHHRAAF